MTSNQRTGLEKICTDLSQKLMYLRRLKETIVQIFFGEKYPNKMQGNSCVTLKVIRKML